MAGPGRATDAARSDLHQALTEGRRRRSTPPARPAAGPMAVLALQRFAGNSAVSALMAARMKFPGEQATKDIDGALKELRRDEPVIDSVEKGLKAAQAAGIPVELEGPKPPASALAVKTTGFGPEAVAPKKPVPPPKPVPAKHPLGKAGARAPHPGRHGGGAPPVPAPAAPAPTTAPEPLPADKLLEPPKPPAHLRPEEDAAFTRVTKHVTGFAHAKRSHAPAHAKATEAQAAAVPPTDDLAGQAKAAKADTMDAQHPGSFDKKAFIAAVKAAIEAKSPKTLKEADDYKESGKAGEVKGDVKGLVGQGKEGQAKDIETATAAPPDQSKAVPKQVTPMSAEEPGQPAEIPADGAVPKPAPPDQLNLAAGKQQADQEMADGGVTEQQLADSNEPQFQQALTDKQTAAAHADTAPGQYRQQEQQVIEQGKADANAQTTAGVAGMQGSKAAAIAQLVAHKAATKSKDEAKRTEVTGRIQAIFTATEADVKKILDGIDPKVDAAFEAGEKDARGAFETYVAQKMAAYKEDRYSGWLGGLRWAKDKLVGMPDKVNEFFTAGRELYLQRMDGVISKVADIVGGDLTAAKQRIAKGKADIATYVKSLPKDLQKVGTQATKEIGDRFAQLESDVDAKQESVVDSLATKYVDARKGLDERIEELQAENKGLVDKAISAIKAVVGTIRDLINMLTNVLARAASVVGDIIKHPVRFLGNLIDGVKGGILKFKDNILDHLRKGLMSWLFGALAAGGIELPETFDLKGIIHLLASIFGLTWTNIRNRIVKKIGEKAMAAAEKGVDIFQKIASGGIGALWEMFVEKLGDIKEMILEQVKDFVVTKIITAGITWLISLLNPAAAFIKACKLIYDVVMFFVENAERIAKFVNTVLDSVADIVRGNISSVVNKIDDVLGQMVPILISFLADVIGLGGISEKIHSIIQTLQKPVNKALDFIINAGMKLAGPIIRGIAGISGRVKAKVAAGKAWVKGKVEAGKEYVKGKAAGIKAKLTGKKSGDEGLAAARAEADRALTAPGATPESVRGALPGIKSAHGLSQVELRTGHAPSTYHVHVQTSAVDTPDRAVGAASTDQKPGHAKDASGALLVGRTGSYSSLSGKQDPRYKGFPFLKLQAEHVLPRGIVDRVLRAMGFQGMSRVGGEYQEAETIAIYEGAANAKTEKYDTTSLSGLEASAQRIATPIRENDPDPDKRSQAHGELEELIEQHAQLSTENTRIVVGEEDAANRAARGNQDVVPQAGSIAQVAGKQAKQAKHDLLTEQAHLSRAAAQGSANSPLNLATALNRLLHGAAVTSSSVAQATVKWQMRYDSWSRKDPTKRSDGTKRVYINFEGQTEGTVRWSVQPSRWDNPYSSGTATDGSAASTIISVLDRLKGVLESAATRRRDARVAAANTAQVVDPSPGQPGDDSGTAE